MAWYSARCAFRHPGLAAPEGSAVFEERLVLLRAEDEDEAIAKAEREAEAYGAASGAEYLGFVGVYGIPDETLGEGSEVYSLMRTCELDDEGFVERFLDTGTEHSEDQDAGPTLYVRAGEAEDAPALSELAMAAKAHWGYAPALLEAWRGELEIDAAYLASHTLRLAEDEEGLAGFYALGEGPGDWTLEHLWVAPARLRQGLGRALLEHARALAAAGGASAIVLDAEPFAEAFYLACGAERVGARPAPIPGDAARVLPRMRLPLD